MDVIDPLRSSGGIVSKGFARSVVVLFSCCAAALGFAVAAAGISRGVACDALKGSTLQENHDARVFTSHGKLYACARPNGRSHVLLWHQSGHLSASVSDVQLAGHFVAWKQLSGTMVGSDGAVVVLDLTQGNLRHRAEFNGDLAQLEEYVLNADGAVVWILQQFNTDHVYETTGNRTSTLETTSDTGGNSGPGSLGLSHSGRVAYWITGGQFRGAGIR
jgi:hypothetical protein